MDYQHVFSLAAWYKVQVYSAFWDKENIFLPSKILAKQNRHCGKTTCWLSIESPLANVHQVIGRKLRKINLLFAI